MPGVNTGSQHRELVPAPTPGVDSRCCIALDRGACTHHARSMLFEVAVRSPLRRLFTYESDENLQQGVRVRVPFRSREVVGVVWRETQVSPKGLKKIIRACDDVPFFDASTLKFYERSAQYYGISLGELLAGTMPKKIQEGEQAKTFEVKKFTSNLATLSDDQQKIADEIERTSGFQIHLLMGEMGSGKTEIYLSLIDRVIREGSQALLLVPEISLTPQLHSRLSNRLGGEISIFHSQLTEKKRLETFGRALDGKPNIFLGARSALLLPFKNLKLIVVDEEHDSSYKQSERGPYHARDLAILRAQLFNIPIILGSGTPSLESYERARETKSPIYRLSPFYPMQKPETQIIDLKKSWESNGRSFLSEPLHDAMAKQLERGEQTLLFLNRRGSASQRVCLSCGSVDECKSCSVQMTIHDDLKKAICHWCDWRKPLGNCSACGSSEFFLGGIGTKEVETQIKMRFPEARVARLDRDEAAKKNVLQNTLHDFAEGALDILIGTQIISKGIDIPKLSLVGVVLADQGWGVPDFRGTERSFQLLRQLMGRGGRRGQPSQFIVQTFRPDHPIFGWLQEDGAFEKFAEQELAVRKETSLPPFSRLALICFSHANEPVLMRTAEEFSRKLEQMGKALGVTILGPTPAPIAKWKGKYRMHLLAKAPLRGHMTTFITAALDEWQNQKSPVQMKLDRDPYQLL
jgi:primosomal protein N' (replication factor Y)